MGRIECKLCHKQNYIGAMNDKFTSSLMKDQMAAHKILSVNYHAQKALPVLYKHLGILESLVCKPSVDMLHCQEAIRECYRVLGNFHIRDWSKKKTQPNQSKSLPDVLITNTGSSFLINISSLAVQNKFLLTMIEIILFCQLLIVCVYFQAKFKISTGN